MAMRLKAMKGFPNFRIEAIAICQQLFVHASDGAVACTHDRYVVFTT
jgi:hypothetical protein